MNLRSIAKAAALTLLAGSGVEVALSACSLPGTSPSSTPPVATLQPRYVVQGLLASGRLAEDALGNPIKVYAETLYFTTADTTYIQATRYGAWTTGTEVISNRRSTPQRYTVSAAPSGSFGKTIALPGMIGGVGTASYYDTTYLSVSVRPNGSTNQYFWSYLKR